jgi:hypothetical protein
MRERDGVVDDAGSRHVPHGCPRGRDDCQPLSRCASVGMGSYMCCGQTDSAPVPTDILRLCIKSTHDRGPVDVLVNIDKRDATDTAWVLLGGLASLELDDALKVEEVDRG